MKEVRTGTYIRITENGDETYNFNFYTDLSASNKLKFVNSVVGVLVDESHYNSVIRDLIFDFYIVDIMTDIDTAKLAASEFFLDDVEEFLEETNIVEIVKANVNPLLLDELNDAVNKSVQYLTGIHSNPLSDAITSLVYTIESKINEVDLDSLVGMAQKFANMTEDFTMESAMNAYMNSDVHKSNLAEIIEYKNAQQ